MERKVAIFCNLAYLFCDSIVKNTHNQIIEQAKKENLELFDGWMPVRFLSKLKALRSIVKSPEEITEIVELVAQSIFEILPCRTYIRRRTPYTADQLSDHIQERFGYNTVNIYISPHTLDILTLSSILSNYGPIKNLESSSTESEGYVFSATFNNFKDAVTVASKSHKYQNVNVIVTFGIKPITKSYENIVNQSSVSVGVLSRINHYENNRWIKLFTEEESLSFPPNVYMKYFQEFAQVSSIYQPPHCKYAFLLFRKSIARQVLGVIKKKGEVEIGNEHIFVDILNENEELIAWKLKRHTPICEFVHENKDTPLKRPTLNNVNKIIRRRAKLRNKTKTSRRIQKPLSTVQKVGCLSDLMSLSSI